jgi:F420-dependent oxidoreductase-like protein
MELGLQISNFTWGIDPVTYGAKLGEIARNGEDAGYTSIWVMDHLFQIPPVGPAQLEMFEAYTALGYLAACTKKARLGTMVTGVTYRHPGILAKQIATLDVLSGGRAWLGIGAAWFEREHLGLGVPFPPLRERFERLEECLQICKQMWSDDVGPYEGRHYRLTETLSSPQPLSKPHPPILIGGSGEKKTLRFVAQYGDACNVRADSPEMVAHRLGVLRDHCDAVGRDYNSIQKTVISRLDPGPNGERSGQVVEMLGKYADVGVQAMIGYLVGLENPKTFEVMARDVFPQIAKL